jgi:ABC-type polysaccharide/polyol phosphate export permease
MVLATYNPLFHLIDVTRAPLLGTAPSATSWIFVVGLAVAGWLLTIYVFARFRRRIAFWL